MRYKRLAPCLFLLALTACSDSGTSRSSSDTGSSAGAGKTTTDKRQVDGAFDRITISVPANVVVELGKEPASVELTGQDDIVKLITSKVDNGKLIVDLPKKHIDLHDEIKISIASPVVKGIDALGAGSLDIEKLQGDSFDLNVSGAYSTRAHGKLNHLKVVGSGASNLDLGDLECKEAKVSVEGAGSAVVNATDSLDVHVSGAAAVKYKGHPDKLNKNVSGVASIEELH